MQSRWIRLCSSQTTLRYCKNVSILASEAQAAADEVDAVAIDEMVDQIIHDDSEWDDSSTTSDVVTISSDDDVDHVDVSGSIQTTSMCPLPGGDWLDMETMMSLLKDPPADICHSHAPNGDKSDSYFLVSNDDNVKRCKAGHATCAHVLPRLRGMG